MYLGFLGSFPFTGPLLISAFFPKKLTWLSNIKGHVHAEGVFVNDSNLGSWLLVWSSEEEKLR